MLNLELHTRKTRIALLLCGPWLIIALAIAFASGESCYEGRERCVINVSSFATTFLLIGVLPVTIVLGINWVLAVPPTSGQTASKESKVKPGATREPSGEPEQTVTCPTCKNRVKRLPGQIDSKCLRCGTAFRY